MFIYALIASLAIGSNPGHLDYMGSGYTVYQEDEMLGVKGIDGIKVLTDEDIDLIARCVYAEAGGQSSATREAVTCVILNRVLSKEKYPDNVHDVLYAKNQFVIADKYNDDVMRDVKIAINYYGTCYSILPEDVYYFRSGHYHNFAKDYKKIGDLYFSR